MSINKDLFVLVLCGGRSQEREVSLRSGQNVFGALQRLGFKNSHLLDFNSHKSLEKILELKLSAQLDLVFLTTHGNYGEDGCIQGFLELLDLPYTGSKVEASANCMSKLRSKEILDYYGLPVLPTIKIDNLDDLDLLKKTIPEDSELMLKAISEGSSRNISKHKNLTALKTFMENNLNQEDRKKYFIEPYIKGKEITTSILELKIDSKQSPLLFSKDHCFESKNLLSLPILELRPKNEIYDYEAKYTPGMTDFVLPAELNKDLERSIHEIALKAFQTMNCRNLARVDFIIDKNSKPWILELNTLPGMTETSDMPAQAKAAGISFDNLILNILNSAPL
jgi:D-alanine-D-alanine ligase